MAPLKKISFISIVIVISSFLGTVSAQEGKSALTRGSIEDQFKYIVEKSSRYQNFKVVEETSLNALRSNVLDSLKKLRNNLKASNEIIAAHKTDMDSVKTELQTSNNRLEETFREKNSIRFLGILMSKEAYSRLMWIIVAALAAVLAAFIILFRRSNSITTQNKIALQETRDEFDKFRKRALEREQELSRNHLAELNKYRKQSSGG